MKSCSLFVMGLVLWTVSGQRRPPNYAQNQMPSTSFSCRDKIIGGYYADPETDCQMFHVCVKIPGRGVQDFRFLCPNDTSFDQENQICDDWYNIDCEASTLFYSDNFDLYRIGGDHGKHGAKLPSIAVNNAVSDLDDNYNYLQKSDRGENVPGDLLRGSHSGNFFSNKNRGREYDDDVKETNTKDKVKDKQSPEKSAHFKDNFSRSRNSNFNRNQYKTASTTVQPTTAEVTTVRVRGQNFAQRNDYYRRQQQVTDAPVQNNYNPTTLRPAFESARNYQQPKGVQNAFTSSPQYNQNTHTTPQYSQNAYTAPQQKQYNPPAVQQKQVPQNTQTPAPVQKQYNQNSYSTPAQNQFNQNTFTTKAHQKQFNQNTYTTPVQKQFNQNTYTTPAQQKQFNQNAYTTPAQQFNQNSYTNPTQQKQANQNTYTTPAQQKPLNQNYNPVSQNTAFTTPNQNQYQNTYTPQKPAQNQFNQQFTTSAQNQYNQNSFSTQNQFGQNAYTTQNYQTFVPSTQKPFARNTFQPQNTFQTTFPPQNFVQSSTQNYQQYSQNYDVPKTHVSTTIRPYVDAQTYRGTFETTSRAAVNSNYETQRLYKINTGSAPVDDSKDEFLKTAHSQNLGASRLNRVHSAYKGFNATVAASYNFIPSEDPTTLKPRYQTTAATPTTTTVGTSTAKEDYDYAYYDNGSPSEYDNLELDFRRTTPRKNT